jgi:hypothetical protein
LLQGFGAFDLSVLFLIDKWKRICDSINANGEESKASIKTLNKERAIMKTIETVTYVLPACWASYLINGDSSGLSADDYAAANNFINGHGLPMPVSCSDESWFAWHNDAGTLGGDVLEYTFLLPV